MYQPERPPFKLYIEDYDDYQSKFVTFKHKDKEYQFNLGCLPMHLSLLGVTKTATASDGSHASVFFSSTNVEEQGTPLAKRLASMPCIPIKKEPELVEENTGFVSKVMKYLFAKMYS